ncbi:MAG: hemerythrin domain-containing protein [Rikenellaceae bacterium]|jgi:regulator of cell morphogenesis and NO signaling|nr:hemerythrin domain-containing protein [Rikenellaceae bacterium]
MYRLGKYDENDSMSALISENYPVLLVMSRFGIPLGVGDASIGEVCRRNGVDTRTFLAVTNLLLDEEQVSVVKDVGTSVEALLVYLHNSHDYFLEFRLPAVRTKLVEAVGTADDLSQAIIRYFDQYVDEVRRHMAYEEKTVFPYVRALISGKRPDDYSIAVFGRQHDQVEARLTEFKQILIKYYPAQSTNEINGVLFDIFSCERDLASHNAVEDRLFVPAIAALERKIGDKR